MALKVLNFLQKAAEEQWKELRYEGWGGGNSSLLLWMTWFWMSLCGEWLIRWCVCVINRQEHKANCMFPVANLRSVVQTIIFSLTGLLDCKMCSWADRIFVNSLSLLLLSFKKSKWAKLPAAYHWLCEWLHSAQTLWIVKFGLTHLLLIGLTPPPNLAS